MIVKESGRTGAGVQWVEQGCCFSQNEGKTSRQSVIKKAA